MRLHPSEWGTRATAHIEYINYTQYALAKWQRTARHGARDGKLCGERRRENVIFATDNRTSHRPDVKTIECVCLYIIISVSHYTKWWRDYCVWLTALIVCRLYKTTNYTPSSPWIWFVWTWENVQDVRRRGWRRRRCQDTEQMMDNGDNVRCKFHTDRCVCGSSTSFVGVLVWQIA